MQAERLWTESVRLYAGDPDHFPGFYALPTVTALHLLADNICDTDMKYGFATWDRGFMDEYVTLRLENGRLVAEVYLLFKDGSGRSNYFTREVYVKVPPGGAAAREQR